jgi:hypothetical protein
VNQTKAKSSEICGQKNEKVNETVPNIQTSTIEPAVVGTKATTYWKYVAFEVQAQSRQTISPDTGDDS